MKRKLCLLALILGLVIPIISCSPIIADSSFQLESWVEPGMTLDEVKQMMSPELTEQTLVYPAGEITERADGKWVFEPKEGGLLSDSEAPYHVLIVFPKTNEQEEVSGHYFLFFKDKKFFADGHFDASTSWEIQEILFSDPSTE